MFVIPLILWTLVSLIEARFDSVVSHERMKHVLRNWPMEIDWSTRYRITRNQDGPHYTDIELTAIIQESGSYVQCAQMVFEGDWECHQDSYLKARDKQIDVTRNGPWPKFCETFYVPLRYKSHEREPVERRYQARIVLGHVGPDKRKIRSKVQLVILGWVEKVKQRMYNPSAMIEGEQFKYSFGFQQIFQSAEQQYSPDTPMHPFGVELDTPNRPGGEREFENNNGGIFPANSGRSVPIENERRHNIKKPNADDGDYHNEFKCGAICGVVQGSLTVLIAICVCVIVKRYVAVRR